MDDEAVSEEENYVGNTFDFSTRPDISWLDRYRQQRSSGCVWRLHRAALNKMLLVLSGGLILAALVMCFLSACSNEDTKRVTEKQVSRVYFRGGWNQWLW